ncbi:MAG: hypothetical protein ABSF50_17105 [Burkholderiaceae bacterium]|jgi:hypothetical protein
MKILVVLLKIWALLSLMAAVAIAVMLWDDGHSMTIGWGDDLLEGPSAAVAAGLLAAVGVFAAGLVVSTVVAIVGVVVPCALVLVLACVAIALGAAGIAVVGSILVASSPVLLVVIGCVLLVRLIRRRRTAQPSTV